MPWGFLDVTLSVTQTDLAGVMSASLLKSFLGMELRRRDVGDAKLAKLFRWDHLPLLKPIGEVADWPSNR